MLGLAAPVLAAPPATPAAKAADSKPKPMSTPAHFEAETREWHACRRDTSEELERRLAEHTAQLELAHRELEDFTYSVAHDLRAPLRAITSFSDALEEDCAGQLDETGQDYMLSIRKMAQRMSDLLNGILALSKANRASLKSSQCDLSAMARAISEQLQADEPTTAAPLEPR